MKRNRIHLLLGAWTQKIDWNNLATCVEYTISIHRDKLKVSGIDTSDGEELVISHVRWDGDQLKFNTLCPSTKWKAKHVFRLKGSKFADHEITYTESEVWEKRRPRKKSVRP